MAYGAQYSFGVFFTAMLDEFGWTRASLSGAFSLYLFAYSTFALVAGRLTDLWGPRAVIATGALFLGAGLAIMSGVRQIWHPYVIYGLIAAVGMSTAFVPCSATVARWFVRRRGLAIGLAFAGMGLGTLVMPPAAQIVSARLGWRGAYVALGAAVFLVVSLVATVMRRDPESLGLLPDGSVAPARGGAGPRGVPWTIATAPRTRVFWMLFGLFTATWIPVFGPLVHLVPMARGLGVSPLVAATLVSALGLSALFGRLLMGGVSDYAGRRPTLAVSLGLQVVAFGALASCQSVSGLYVGAALFGFSYGGVSVLFSALVADFFGREEAGSLVGLFFATAGSTSALGPLAAGWVFDHAASYAPWWWASAVSNAVALALLAFTHPPDPAAGPRA